MSRDQDKMSRRDFLQVSAGAAGAYLIPAQQAQGATHPFGSSVPNVTDEMRTTVISAPAHAEAEEMRGRFLVPPMDCRPHTR
ncbi:MAG: twin-arginine translocation signal domain-containing protein [Acidobacteriaceae bacterium]